MNILIRTLHFERGELYFSVDGRRVLLAKCKPAAEIYERVTKVPMLGSRSAKLKKTYLTLVLCDEMDTTREVTETFLRTVERFELYADIQREDGIFERIAFRDISDLVIEGEECWTFQVEDPTVCRKLMDI